MILLCPCNSRLTPRSVFAGRLSEFSGKCTLIFYILRGYVPQGCLGAVSMNFLKKLECALNQFLIFLVYFFVYFIPLNSLMFVFLGHCGYRGHG